MKKTLIFLALIAVSVSIFCLFGCSGSQDSASTTSDTDKWGMVCVGSMKPNGGGEVSNVCYYRDISTDVMYIYFSGRGSGYGGAGGLTVMYNPETGLPLTYTRYMEIYKNLEDELRCTECGEQIGANHKFCPECGTQVKE